MTVAGPVVAPPPPVLPETEALPDVAAWVSVLLRRALESNWSSALLVVAADTVFGTARAGITIRGVAETEELGQGG